MQRIITKSGEIIEKEIPKNKINNNKRAKSPEYEDNVSNNKKRKKQIQLNVEELSLSCKYISCDFITDNYNTFLSHIESHLWDLEEIEDELECMWDNCVFKCDSALVLKQHLHYHGYHTKLLNIGSNLVENGDLPACKYKTEYKIPALPETYPCEWSDCNLAFFEYQVFLDHVKCHIICKEEIILCQWQGCRNRFSSTYKLQDHVKTHTKEKLAACPTCGNMFASKTKLVDHRKRQLSCELQDYQCVQCSKLFASERLLRDHTRVHINHYKCHLCDMTCSKPSMLSKHIRYRHLPDRPFKCDICSHSTVSYQDLLVHRDTHNNQKVLKCESCDFSCRTKMALVKHQSKEHDNDWESKYACHCCEKMFTRGALLTKHLIKVHDFHWPSGHSRFLYKQDVKTGLYHLQVVRYESLEVTEEMMQGNVACQQALTQNYKYECKASTDNPMAYELKIATESSKPNEKMIKVENKDKEDAKTLIIESGTNEFGQKILIEDRTGLSLEKIDNESFDKLNENNDGNAFRFEFVDMDATTYESDEDEPDNLIICS